MTLEAQKVAAFVFDTLKADTGPGGFNTLIGGRLYRDQIPQAAALPAALLAVIASVPSNTLGGVRVASDVQIDVHLVGAGANYAPINPAAERAEALLQNRSGTSGGVQIVELVLRDARFEVENESGTSYTHLIQNFETKAHSI